MSLSQFYLLLLIAGSFSHSLYANIRVDNLSNYNFGMVRPGAFPVKESSFSISAPHYTVAIYGHSDNNVSFNLANGIYKVPYTISWKDNSGNFSTLLPNIMSSVFNGANAYPAILQMQIKGNFPKPGHYSDTLTLIITPA